MIYGGCVCVGTADNEGLDMLMRSMVVVWMVVMQSKWKKVECREEGDSVLNLSALSLVSGDASQCLTYLWNFDLRIFFFFYFLSTLWVS